MFELLALTVTLAAFAATAVAASLAVAVAWPALARTAERASPRAEARLLYALRLVPTIAAALVGLVAVLPSWNAFEPRATRETPGMLALVLAGLATVLVLQGLARALRSWAAAQGLVHRWSAHAEPLSLPGLGMDGFRTRRAAPPVCIVGALRPRLFISDAVLQSCRADELAAVLGHERAHVAAHDNFKRLLAHGLPDLLPHLPSGRRLEKAWTRASEAAADADVGRQDPRAGVALAGALVKVARLMTDRSWAGLPAHALVDHEGIAARIQRLLAPQFPSPALPKPAVLVWILLGAAPLGLALLSARPAVQQAIHVVLEALVQAR